jgi:hypothetical protein
LPKHQFIKACGKTWGFVSLGKYLKAKGKHSKAKTMMGLCKTRCNGINDAGGAIIEDFLLQFYDYIIFRGFT